VVLGDSTAPGLDAPSPEGGYVGQALAGKFAADGFHPSQAGYRDWSSASAATLPCRRGFAQSRPAAVRPAIDAGGPADVAWTGGGPRGKAKLGVSACLFR
jgi:hypothetical protein